MSALRRWLSPLGVWLLRRRMRALRAALPVLERLAFGGERRERLLLAALERYYESLFRRQWIYPRELPPYFDHRIDAFAFATGRGTPFAYYRGFFAAELLRPGDTLLDIGCGDGFFARRFYAPRCAAVDAIDVDRHAIEHARRRNHAANVRYVEMDAVAEPFPRDRYEVVLWDSGLAHFAPETNATMLAKIRAALAAGGVFAGSESLGDDGDDHLQEFDTLDDVGEVLTGAFPHVRVRELEYEIAGGRLRREAFWRCAVDSDRLDAVGWRVLRADRAAQPA